MTEKGETIAHFIQNTITKKNENMSMIDKICAFYDKPLALLMTKIIQKTFPGVRDSLVIMEKYRIKCAKS